MAYYEDLTPYTYGHSAGQEETVNIGWLDERHDFPTGDVSAAFVERLKAFCRTRVMQTRGFHECPLCNESSSTEWQEPEDNPLSSAELRVFGEGKRVYAAPSLVCHYVAAHHYRPPDEFVNAVLAGPLPDTPEYEQRAAEYGWYRDYRQWQDKPPRERPTS